MHGPKRIRINLDECESDEAPWHVGTSAFWILLTDIQLRLQRALASRFREVGIARLKDHDMHAYTSKVKCHRCFCCLRPLTFCPKTSQNTRSNLSTKARDKVLLNCLPREALGVFPGFEARCLQHCEGPALGLLGVWGQNGGWWFT